jgi:aspartyl-tRNA(Asn)/glutamyl-tRNA(Gln) amidotransferase subunit C
MEEEDFNKLCHLCHISVSGEEKDQLFKSVAGVLKYVQLLNEVDTEGVSPCFTVHEALRSVMRDDQPEAPLPRDLFLADAPSHVSGMIRVPPVLKNQNLKNE